MNSLLLFPLDSCSTDLPETVEEQIRLEQEISAWIEGEADLPQLVKEGLNQAEWAERLPPKITGSRAYCRVVERVRKAASTNTRQEAIRIASYLPLVMDLAVNHRFSAAAIAVVLRESDPRLTVHWRVVQKMFGILGIRQELVLDDVKTLLQQDETDSRTRMADADRPAMVQILSDEATQFGLDLEDALQDLFGPINESSFTPYLQMLLFSCVIA